MKSFSCIRFSVFLLSVVFTGMCQGYGAKPLFLELSAHGHRVDLGLAEFSSWRSKVDEASMARQIREITKNDLLFPKIFNLVEGGAPPLHRDLDVKSWQTLGVDVIVTGYVNTGWFGRFQFIGALHDAHNEKKILEKKYVVDFGDERMVAHKWANEIIHHFTGDKGVANSRISFVNDQTGKKEVYVVDYDGNNLKQLTHDHSIALFPKFSPDGKSLVYTTYRQGSSDLFVMNSDGSNQRPLCQYEGLNSAAVWLPNGESLVATLSLGSDPNLHIVDLKGRVVRTLTNSSSVDTAPTLSSNGLHMAFTSDRPGNPQIYTMDIVGTNIKRLTRSGQCDSPSWSPQGHLVAFTKSEGGKNFDIYTVELGTRRENRLTWGEGDNENPSWSPDGRYLVFTSNRRGRSELWIMGFDGSGPRPVGDIGGRSFTPHWSP